MRGALCGRRGRRERELAGGGDGGWRGAAARVQRERRVFLGSVRVPDSGARRRRLQRRGALTARHYVLHARSGACDTGGSYRRDGTVCGRAWHAAGGCVARKAAARICALRDGPFCVCMRRWQRPKLPVCATIAHRVPKSHYDAPCQSRALIFIPLFIHQRYSLPNFQLAAAYDNRPALIRSGPRSRTAAQSARPHRPKFSTCTLLGGPRDPHRAV